MENPRKNFLVVALTLELNETPPSGNSQTRADGTFSLKAMNYSIVRIKIY